MADPVFADAAFLSSHPGWTWDDLQGAPDEIVEIIRMIDAARKRMGK